MTSEKTLEKILKEISWNADICAVGGKRGVSGALLMLESIKLIKNKKKKRYNAFLLNVKSQVIVKEFGSGFDLVTNKKKQKQN